MSSKWNGVAGDAFFRPSGLKEHLFIVLYNPDHFPNEGFGKRLCIATVNLTSVKQEMYFDPACIVEPGEHSFIVQQSYVLYGKLELEDHAHAVNCVNNGTWRVADRVSDDLLNRIRNGIQISTATPRKYKKIFK